MPNKKFRIRRFIRQYFKENQKEGFLSINTKNFSDHQNAIVMAELWNKKILKKSRKRNQAVSIGTHKARENDNAEEKE